MTDKITEAKIELRNASDELGISNLISSAKIGMYIFLQVLCYIMFIVLIFLVLAFPSSLTMSSDISERTHAQVKISNDDLTTLIRMVQMAGLLISSGFLISALLLGRLRKKHQKLVRAAKVMERVRKILES